MAKNTFYFSHDYNARNDIKIKKLISKHGYLGYGIFWAIIEDLYNNENLLQLDYEIMTYDLRCSEDILRSIINDFDLFVVNDGGFGSRSVQSRLDERYEKSKNAKELSKKRWEPSHTPARLKANECIFYILKIYSESESFIKVGITTESISRRYSGKLNGYSFDVLYQNDLDTSFCLDVENLIHTNFSKYTPKVQFHGYLECYKYSDCQIIIDFAMRQFEIRNTDNNFRNPIKESKIKEKKVKEINEIKEIIIVDSDKIDFDFFWNSYGKKVGDRVKLKRKWDNLPYNDQLAALEYIPKYIESQPEKQYRKNPETFLNNKSWNDELIYKQTKVTGNKHLDTLSEGAAAIREALGGN